MLAEPTLTYKKDVDTEIHTNHIMIPDKQAKVFDQLT